MSAFHRLHPQLRHALVNELGWRSLRPVQELATEAILDGCNAVVLAPTAGGKTEASLFPVLSRILSEELEPVAALYVCPIRALLNNQEARVQRYARMVGLDAFKWHGDVPGTARARFLREPAHVLMITPESLEVMLISQKTDARSLFRGLSAVIIDEVHAFASDDRGAHLVSVLERLVHFCGRDVQRIGLSATVGNPDIIGQWLMGSSRRPYRRVDPPRPPAVRDLRLGFLENTSDVAAEAARLGQGKKSLVFVESRAEAERIAGAMAGRGVEVFIHHSAVSRADRELAEEQFARGHNTAIVCTSTMELGIDVGDLDQVLQVDAPMSVASLLQRMGRTGRREGMRSNCTFLCQSPESLLQATALVRLAERGWVEDVRPPAKAAHVLAHQVLALGLQEGGVSRHQVLPWVAAASPFRGLDAEDVSELVETMLARRILHEAEGLLSLGLEGERLYGRKNFFELYAVFSSPPLLRVMHGPTEIGTVQATFARSQEDGHGPLCFRLGGRPWLVVHVDWERGTCQVQPADKGRVPSWLGPPRNLSWMLCQEMKRTLADEAPMAVLGKAAQLELQALRREYEGLVGEGEAPLEVTDEGVQWHTFAGGAINRLLAVALESETGRRWTPGNLSIKVKDAGLSWAALAIAALPRVDWGEMASAQVGAAVRGSLSKFQRCLPPRLEAKLLVERLYDVEGTRAFVSTHRVPSSSPG
ncbi:DEAD/DEAH box helicase [Myxococcus fulvus]|uniref:DEAD/DEAH box helicase n=1 Tax=Myxococcus fulvus TaxID=33 RepID=UPI00237B21EF|nr:DEAD/DEAH box helicase [Myxococcus fulvus]